MGAAEVQLRGSDYTKAAARSGFKGYGPGKRQRTGKAAVKEDETAQKLKAALLKYLKFKYSPYGNGEDNLHRMYRDACSSIEGIQCSKDDIERFCIALVSFPENGQWPFSDRAGFLLSALINISDEEKFTLQMEHFVDKINKIGFYNKKNLVINGDVGHHAGEFMRKGSLTINGDVGGWLGKGMYDGDIVVNGFAHGDVGYEMYGGHIIIHGNATRVGIGMTGGTIEVNGDAGDVGWVMNGGKIIVRGDVHGYVGSDSDENISITSQSIMERALRDSLSGWAAPYPETNFCMVGGEIHIHGEIENLGRINGGKVYHKGKLIVDK